MTCLKYPKNVAARLIAPNRICRTDTLVGLGWSLLVPSILIRLFDIILQTKGLYRATNNLICSLDAPD